MNNSTSERMVAALFLDRDGVLNRQIIGGYVTRVEEFEFLPGVLEALTYLSTKFQYIFIVTNQQGIGKGFFTEDDLTDIHGYMLDNIIAAGGKIDKIYYCPALEKDDSVFRKPRTGMGQQALSEFPDVDINKSVMVGDSVSDMQFGRGLGLTTVFLTKGRLPDESLKPDVDKFYTDLSEYAQALK